VDIAPAGINSAADPVARRDLPDHARFSREVKERAIPVLISKTGKLARFFKGPVEIMQLRLRWHPNFRMPAEVRAQPGGTRILGTYADEIWATMSHGNRKT